MNSKTRNELDRDLKEKAFREAYVESHINDAIAYQIRAMRKARGWNQKQLGERIPGKMAQEAIARLENPNYGRYSLDTLKRLAAAFDVALIVRFARFSELVNWSTYISPEALNVPAYENDPGLKRQATFAYECSFNTDVVAYMEGVSTYDLSRVTAAATGTPDVQAYTTSYLVHTDVDEESYSLIA